MQIRAALAPIALALATASSVKELPAAGSSPPRLEALILEEERTESRPPPPTCEAECRRDVGMIADEAVRIAAALPAAAPGRDVAVRAISRNLRWFGWPEQGILAAQAIAGSSRTAELAAATRGSQPALMRLDEGMYPDDPCHSADWIIRGIPASADAPTPPRDERVASCILDRSTHWSGPPPLRRLVDVYGALEPSPTKARLLHYILIHFQRAETVRWAEAERDRLEAMMPADEHESFALFMDAPPALYWRSRREEAIAIARNATDPGAILPMIELLVEEGAADDAIDLLEPLDRANRKSGAVACSDWFGEFGSIQLSNRGAASQARIAAFLDRLPRSPAFRRRCPGGAPPDAMPDLLIAAGRSDQALALVRRTWPRPRLAELLMDEGRGLYFAGDAARARSLWLEGAAALPLTPTAEIIPHRPAARTGLALVEALAAVGEIEKARALAMRFPNAAWRAVALSMICAGRTGLRQGMYAVTAEQIDPEQVPFTGDGQASGHAGA